MKPFSQAAENNKGPILDVLRDYLTAPGDLLEIGAGTGQHAVWLAPHFPQVLWTPTELPENLDGLSQWLADAPSDNLAEPLALEALLYLGLEAGLAGAIIGGLLAGLSRLRNTR